MLPTRRRTVLWPFPSQSVAELAELEESGRLWWYATGRGAFAPPTPSPIGEDPERKNSDGEQI